MQKTVSILFVLIYQLLACLAVQGDQTVAHFPSPGGLYSKPVAMSTLQLPQSFVAAVETTGDFWMKPLKIGKQAERTRSNSTGLIMSDTSYYWYQTCWQYSSLTVYQHDADSYLVDKRNAYMSGANWVFFGREVMTYDVSGRLETSVFMVWASDHWSNSDKTTFTFDSEGNVTEVLSYIWSDSAGGTWVSSMRSTSVYLDGLEQSLTLEFWVDSAWEFYLRTLFSYGSDQRADQALAQTWTFGVWADSRKTAFYYDTQGRDTLELVQAYNDDWDNYSMTQRSFDGLGNKTLKVSWEWKSNAWNRITSDTLRYSGSLLTEEVNYKYLSNSLVRTLHEYDIQNNLVLDLEQNYLAGSGWVNSSRTAYVYDLPTFVCGDADGSGDVNVSDAVYLLCYIFRDCAAPTPLEAADADCSGDINVADVVFLISYIFGAGAAPCSTCQ